MTDNQLKPTQAAREAAARWAISNSRHAQAANIIRGSCDTAPIVQHFARFEADTIARLSQSGNAERAWASFPKKIGRLTLGDRPSQDHYCGGSHEMPDGQPVYWQEPGGEYPDDIEGFCLTCAITNAESDAGWCDCAAKEALSGNAERESGADVETLASHFPTGVRGLFERTAQGVPVRTHVGTNCSCGWCTAATDEHEVRQEWAAHVAAALTASGAAIEQETPSTGGADGE
ncbi:hypothetical protein [Sphingopyxis sp. NJF-3]